MINARKIALKILNDIENKNEFSHVVIARELTNLKLIDKRFITRLVSGVLENKLLLDYYIRKLSKQRFSRIPISTVNILRMGFYQLVYMDKVPDSAAVDESVKLAKSLSVTEAKFVNGILRSFLRSNKLLPLPDPQKHLATYLSVRYSHPEWLVKKWLNSYGPSFTEELLEANNQTPDLCLRVNTLKTNVDHVLKILSEAGIDVIKSPIYKEALIIKDINHLSIEVLPGYEEGFFQIQDISSMCVALISSVQNEDHVLDVCAAPGGKATHMAQLMNDQGLVLARDIHEHKLQRINENAARLGIKSIKTEAFDAKILDEHLKGRMDVVLVDAPCSGFGIIRRKPDIKYKKTLEDCLELSQLQMEIVTKASEYVKVNGHLIYSTCTINEDENQILIKSFLSKNHHFELIPFELGSFGQTDGTMTLFPNVHGTDGFFLAKLKRIK